VPPSLGMERGSAWVLTATGLGLLLIRPLVASGPQGAWILAGIYLAIGAAAIVPHGVTGAVNGSSAENGRRGDLGSVAVLAVGIGAFLAAAATGRPTIHPVVGPTALAVTMLASIAEEAFFRGFLYGRLARVGAPWAIVASAGAFALIHVPAYPMPAVAVDFAAGLLFGWQRWATGTWLVPAATHAAANVLAVTW
jgi:membrane protease YdiL (CAAX protease family)